MDDLAAITRTDNDARGWGEGFSLEVPSNPVTGWAMIGTEVMELLAELDPSGSEGGWKGHFSPARLEIADGIIRCMDLWTLLQRTGSKPKEIAPPPKAGGASPIRITLQEQLSLSMRPYRAIQAARKTEDPGIHHAYLQQHMDQLCELLARHGSDPREVLEYKLEANRSRPWKHGRRY